MRAYPNLEKIMMQSWLRSGAAALAVALAAAGFWPAAPRADEPEGEAGPKAIPILLTLGSADNRMAFTPDALSFEVGKLYKLILVNPSPQRHEFDATELGKAVSTRKVEVISPEGEEVAEIVGAVREIEVAPQATVEWYFVPRRRVARGAFVCDLPGHKAAGMRGTFSIR
jgi:uncharacterized cupredoxin-like copper-binding protein